MQRFNKCIASLLILAMLMSFAPVAWGVGGSSGQVLAATVSVPSISDPFTTHPSVFIVEDTYQIVFATNAIGLAWVEINGVKYEDSLNGLMNWERKYHKISVPQQALDYAKSYVICFSALAERPPYNPAPSTAVRRTYPFAPVPQDRDPVFFCASDQHGDNSNALNISKIKNFDVYVFGGDYIDTLTSDAQLKLLLDYTGAVTQGVKPTIYSRGNHEIRGSQCHNLFRVSGYDNSTGAYYTAQMPGIFGIVLDAGEDKVDSNASYGDTVKFEAYRKEQTEWLKQIVKSRVWEKFPVRMAFAHVPFSFYASGSFEAVYKEWSELLDQMGVSLLISGHTHWSSIYAPGNDRHKADPNFSVLTVSDRKNSKGFDYSASFVSVGSDAYSIENYNNNLALTYSGSVDIFNNAYVSDAHCSDLVYEPAQSAVISATSASSASVPAVSAPYALHPTVYAVEDGYQIVFTTTEMGMGWVNVGGVDYFDQTSGLMNYKSKYHRVRVPRVALDSYRGYTVNFQAMSDRAAYNPVHGDTVSRVYPFSPLADKNEPVFLTVSAFSKYLAQAKASASYKNFDALCIAGDFVTYGNTEAQVRVLLDTASELTQGTKPVFYTRGNLEIRGNEAFLLEKMAPTGSNGKSYYTIEQADFFAIVLDSGEDKVDSSASYGGTVNYQKFRKEQTLWLQQVLEEGKWRDYPTRFVLCHIPPSINTTSGLQEDFADWVNILNQMGISLLISGHHYSHALYQPNADDYSNNANFATLVPCNVDKSDIPYSSSFVTLGKDNITVESVSSDKVLLATSSTPNVSAPSANGDSFLMFDFLNDDRAKDRYRNFVYGGINFDRDCFWEPEPNSTYPVINNGFLTISPASDTVSSVGMFSRPYGNKYGKWGYAPLNYYTKAEDFCQVRFKVDNAVSADGSGVAKFRLDIDCPNDLDPSTSAKDTFIRFEESFVVDEVVGNGYVTLTFPLDHANYTKMDYLHLVHPQFVGLKSESGSTAVFTVDYIYVGPEESFPKQEDYLFFDFDNTAEDQERYDNFTYNYQNFDEPSNWSAYLSSPLSTISDGALKFTIPSATIGTNFSMRSLSYEPKTLHYVPGEKDILQVRVQVKNAVSTSEDGVSKFMMAFDRCNNLPGPDGTNRLWTEVSIDFVLADHVDKDWFVLEIPLTDEEYLNSDWINTVHPQFRNVASAEGKDAEFLIDYIYVGPKEKNPVVEDVIVDLYYAVEGELVTGISVSTPVSEFAEKFSINPTVITVLSAEGAVLADTDTVGTGCSVQIVDSKGTVLNSFTAIVKGDCTGDGLVNSTDVMTMKRTVKKTATLGGSYFKAVDSDGDNVLSTLDYIREKILVKTLGV